MAKLYPPYIEGSLPAGYIENNQWVIRFPYQMNRAVSPVQVSGIRVLIKTIHKNEIVYNNTTNIIPIASTMKNGQFLIELKIEKTQLINIGQYYKIQLAYVDTTGVTGYYSTVGIIKCIDKPTMEIVGMNQYGSNFYNGAFQGVYRLDQATADLSERVYSYCFSIYDDKGKIYATSGTRIHDNNIDQYAYECTDFWTPEKLGEDSKFYQIQYSVTTLNGGEFSSPKYRLQMQAAIDMEPQMVIYPIPDFDNGCIEIVLIGEPNIYTIEETKCTGTYTICRKEINKHRDNSWIEVHRFRLSDEYPSDYTFRDFTVEQGVIYKYSIQQMNNYGVYSKRIISAPAYADFEDMFLFDGKRALKIRFNPKVSSFKTTLQESKTDTIGHKYPYFFRNGNVAYKEFPIAGLLSYFVDDNELFITDEKLGLEADPSPRKNSLRWGSWSDTYPGHSVHEDHEKMVNTLPYSDTNVEYDHKTITYRKNADKLLEKYESYLALLKQINYYSKLDSLTDRPAEDIEHLFSLIRQANNVIRPILMKYPNEFANTWFYDDTFGIKLIRFNELYFYNEEKYYKTLELYQNEEQIIADDDSPSCDQPMIADDCCNLLGRYQKALNEYAIPMKEYFKRMQNSLNDDAALNDMYSEYYQYYNKPTVLRDIWIEERKKEAERKVRTRNFKGYNFYAERTFKLEALDWLNDGRPKLFKSPGEGNYIVRLMNVSMSPEDALSRLIHNFTCQAYEMADARSQADLLNCGLLKIKNYDVETFKPNYHWRTEWMYKYYKPIHSTNEFFYLELDYDYIITIEARDFLLGDWFEIHRKGDPQSDEYWEHIVIGETGNYIMQHELVPIDGIRLKYSDYDYVRPGHIDICYVEKYTSPFDMIKSIKNEPVVTFQLPGTSNNIYAAKENRRFNEWEYLKISLRPFIPVYQSGSSYYLPANYGSGGNINQESGRIKEYSTDNDVLNGQPLIKYSSFLDLVDDVASTWAIYSIRNTTTPGTIKEYRYWKPTPNEDFGTRSTLGNYKIAYPVGALRDGKRVFDTDEDAFIYDIRYAINEVPGTLNDQVSYVEYYNLGRIDRLYLGNGLLLEGTCNNFKIEVAAEVKVGNENGIIKTEETAEIWH